MLWSIRITHLIFDNSIVRGVKHNEKRLIIHFHTWTAFDLLGCIALNAFEVGLNSVASTIFGQANIKWKVARDGFVESEHIFDAAHNLKKPDTFIARQDC
jgi:hypothetical protein